MEDILQELTVAVQALPEFYQPIFGHQVVGMEPKRICTDRLPDVEKIYDVLSEKLNRPLRVLDLGCNLGFFSFHAARRGGVVTAIDFDERNIRVCKILAKEHPDYKIEFVTASIENFVPTIKNGEYDLVFCFSVLHWVTAKFGFPFTQNLLKDLAEKIPNGLFELAMKSEFPNNRLPDNYRDFLQGYSFIYTLSYPVWNNVHMAKRPLCLASKQYVYFEDLGLLEIVNAYSNGNPICPVMYYHCVDKFVKLIWLTNEFQIEICQNELQFLKYLGGKNGLPKLYTHLVENDDLGTRVFLVRDRIDGKTILKKIEDGEDFDRWNVIKQSLQWMIYLENHGYYQNDLHYDNFIFSSDGKIYPIDYGFMTRTRVSVQWPYNLPLAFISFMNQVFNTKVDKNKIARMPYHVNGTKILTEFHRHITDAQYEQILKLKDDEKFFENLYEILFSTEPMNSMHSLSELEILEIEKYLDELGINVQAHTAALNQFAQVILNQQQRIERLERLLQEKSK